MGRQEGERRARGTQRTHAERAGASVAQIHSQVDCKMCTSVSGTLYLRDDEIGFIITTEGDGQGDAGAAGSYLRLGIGIESQRCTAEIQAPRAALVGGAALGVCEPRGDARLAAQDSTAQHIAHTRTAHSERCGQDRFSQAAL